MSAAQSKLMAPAAQTVLRFFPVSSERIPGRPIRPSRTTRGTGASQAGKNEGLLAGEQGHVFFKTVVNGKPVLNGSGGKKDERLAGEKESIPKSPQPGNHHVHGQRIQQFHDV